MYLLWVICSAYLVLLVCRGQSYIAPLLHNIHFIGRNYIVRFAVYTL